jgi:hypothetical protein
MKSGAAADAAPVVFHGEGGARRAAFVARYC